MENILTGNIDTPDNKRQAVFLSDRLKTQDWASGEKRQSFSRSAEIFGRRLSEALDNNLSASDAMRTIIKSALEVEYGTNFTLNKGFDKMIKKLADSMMASPEIRRQALALVSMILEQRSSAEKKDRKDLNG